MKINKGNNKIEIKIPAKNKGKLRFKKRNNSIEFGNTFSTRNKKFDSSVYLEWQIGYDIKRNKLKKNKNEEQFCITKHSFKGANGKIKYPYELPKLIYLANEIGLLEKHDLMKLSEEVENYDEYIDESVIKVEKNGQVELNGIKFEETTIKLPTLFMTETFDNTQIEVSIQKQQYASGVQPMLYFCIPFTSFSNYKELSGKSSKKGDELIYKIDKSNVKVLLDMVKIFGMASERHNFDIKKILEILIKKCQ